MFEAYKIGVTISLVNHVTHGLMALSHDFSKAGADADKLQKRIAAIHLQLAKGALMTSAGMGILHMFKAPLEEAKKFNQEQARFAALGLGDAVAKDAEKTAKSLDLMGQSAVDNMKLLRELTGITGSYEHAKETLPFVAKMKFGMESQMGPEAAGGFESQLHAVIKTSELRGALIDRATGKFSEEKFEHALNMMTQAYVASGGTVKPSDYLAAMKTGGVSTKMMSDEMFYFGLGHYIQELGGNRTGTASMTMFNQIAQGTMSKRVIENLEKEHLLKSGSIHRGKNGSVTADAMGVQGSKQFVENPFEWVNQVVIPQLLKNGHKKGMDLDLALASLFGVRTAKGLADAFAREAPIAKQYIERAKKAANVDQLAEISKNSAYGKELELHAKWNKLMGELGTTILPMAIQGTERLIGLVKHLSAWVEKHPEGAKAMVDSLIVLGGVLVAGGFATNVMALISLVRLLAGGAGLAAAGAGGAGLAAAGRFGVYGAAAAGGAWAGWNAGEWLGNHLGSWAASKYYKGEDSKNYLTPEARARLETMKKPGNTTVHLNVDGKKMATVVLDHMGRQVSGPDHGTSHPDYNQSMPRPAGGFAK